MYVDEIKAAITKYANCPYFENRSFHSMAKRYPDGKLSFWVKKRYEYIEKIKTDSCMLGIQWINSDCPDLTTMNDFICVIDNSLTETLKSTYLDHLSEKYKHDLAKKEIDIFFKLWLEYRAIDAIITALNGNDDLPLTYERLFKDPKECDRLTKIINERACKDGIFTGFNEANPATKINQLKITCEIVAKQYFKPIYTFDDGKGKGFIEAAEKKFFERFGWFGYRGKKPDKPRCADITTGIINKEYISKPNQAAIQEIELILSQK